MRIFVVDGNWYLHRCWFTLRTSRPIEDVLPHNFVSLIMKDACAVKATHVLVAFDGPSVFRYSIYPDYKANRSRGSGETEDGDEAGKDIYEYLPHVRQYLEKCGLTWVQPKLHEADDVLASAAHQYGKIAIMVICGSRDKDGYQSLASNVSAYDSTQDPPVYITVASAEKSKGVKVSQMVMLQTLIGDKIDNIPTLKTLGEARKIINKWGTLKAWYKGAEEKDKAWIRANQVALDLNKKLVEMVTDLALPEINELRIPKRDIKDMPRSWYAYQSWLYPKTRGLFKR